MGGGFALFKYTPSLAAAVIFILLFIITTSIHVFQLWKKRTWYFIPFIIGGFFEIIGYIGRALSHSNTTSISIYILQVVLLLVAPALFAASIYMVLGRMIIFTRAENHAPIRPNWLTKIFVCGDVVSFLIQSGGGGLMANAKSQNTGKVIVVGGLAIQIIFFGIFIITSFIFHRRLVRAPTSVSLRENWTKYMYSLYAAGGLILVRSVFRVIEFLGGANGVLMRTEVYLYIFDAVLMFAVMVIFNVVHPGELINSSTLRNDQERK